MSYITFLTNALHSKSGKAGYVNLPGFLIITSFNVSFVSSSDRCPHDKNAYFILDPISRISSKVKLS